MAKFGVWRILWRILWVPGIALHELAHALAVLLVGRQVRRFEVTLKGGTVHHTGGGSGGLSFAFIAFLPFLLGNALAYIFLKDALALLNEPFDVNPFVGLIFLWLSVSFANASFPSNLDMESARVGLKRNISRIVKRGGIQLLYLLIYGPVLLSVYVFNPIVEFFNSRRAYRISWFFILAFFTLY